MVALILYAFSTGVRSSRAIECHCRQDVAYRVITGNLVPDHATIARFICRHDCALAELFTAVLKLCDRAGLVGPGVGSIDGTRIAGNASPEVNHTFEQIAREIVAEVRATDEAEDEEFGEARGDELPEQLRTPEGRREFFRQAREQLRREQQSPEPTGEPETEATDEAPLEASTPRRSSGTGGRGAMRGCGRASASSSSTAGTTRTRSPGRAASACCWPPSDCKQTTTSGVVPAPPMSSTGRPRATGWVGARAAVQSRTGHRSCRPAR